MGTSKIVFHVLAENPDEVIPLKETLRTLGYDFLFVVDTKDSLQISYKTLEIVILEPRMSEWGWLDALFKIMQDYPYVPVILYSPEITQKQSPFRISRDAHIYLSNDVRTLKQTVEEITGIYEAQKKRILFVDDDVNILKSYERVLRRTPWEIVTASSGETALEILENQEIDILFTDIKMPEMHGIELVSIVRKSHKDLPIVVCSGYDALKDDQDLQFHNIADFLEKPIDSDVLKAKIEELLL